MPSEDDELDEEALREEALAEWLSRGHAAKDFTMEKMWKLWMEEDEGNDEDEDDEDDEDSLRDKQELIRGFNTLGPMVEQAKDAARRLQATARVEARRALQTAWKYAELPPLRRRRLLRQHVVHVHAMDAETHKYGALRQRVVAELAEAKQADAELQFGLKKRNSRRAPLLRRFQEMKAEADRAQRHQETAEIEERRRARVDQELQRKQQQREAKAQHLELLRAQRRDRNQHFWQKHLVAARAFAEQQTLEQERQQAFESEVVIRRQEIEAVEKEEQEDATQELQRRETTSSIGIFDTPLDPGEWRSATDGGHRPGLDEHTIGVLSARGFVVEHERERLELLEVQSVVQMLREKLTQTQQAQTNLSLDRRTVLERKDMLLQELKHVRAEQDELNDMLAGPPRRDPNEAEKRQFHTLVARRAGYMKQLQSLETRNANIQKRMELVRKSEASFGPRLLEAEARQTELEAHVAELERTRHDLPMVVGQAIFQSEGEAQSKDPEKAAMKMTRPFQDPTKLLKQVEMESKLEILRSAAAPVNDHYKKAKAQAIENWKVGEHRALAEQELEDTQMRLAKVRDRFVEHQNTTLRSDIAHAVRRFHEDGNKLRQCIFPLKGQFEWWTHQLPKKSMGLTLCPEQNCISRVPAQPIGRITGCVRLPKRCFYRIQIRVDIENRLDGGDKTEARDVVEQTAARTEDWKLYVGPELDSLQHHVFRDLGGKVLRTGEMLTFEFSGSRLCFSLEISERGAGGPKQRYHYVLSNVARYEERLENFREEENRVRLLQKEKHFVSELVKTMRMQARRTSSQRATELLQELILVEKSRAKLWDSTLFHGHSQRFKRTEYVSMLRREIKKEIAIQIDHDIAVRQGRVDNSQALAASVPIALDSPAKLERKEMSRMGFQARKAALMEPQKLVAKQFLGDYCSFKSQLENGSSTNTANRGAGRANSLATSLSGSGEAEMASYRKETMVVGVRYEWREAKTKLYVTHKLCGPARESVSLTDSALDSSSVKTEWLQLDSANAVYLANACAKALLKKRLEDAEARVILADKDEQIEQLQQETQKNVQEENEAIIREAKEDEMLASQMQHELKRRERLFYADAIRLTTYNENVSSQIDFQVQRKVNVLTDQEGASSPVNMQPIVRDVKETFARQFVSGKLALVRKTWERKSKRVMNKRIKERKEREFRIRQEQQLIDEISTSNERELAKLKAEQEQRAKDELLIPDFQRAVGQSFPCEHRVHKAWGTKYDLGLKCKQCGKEMSKSFNDPDHACGGDRELDNDVQRHRAQITSGIGFRFKDAEHLSKVENERVRLEKEARVMEESEALLYDRVDPKAIDDFNYRHGINRASLLDGVDSSDPIYPRLVQDIHRASHQDELLFHGRLRNFHFRIQQIVRQYASCTTQLSLQHAFLENVQRENSIVLAKLPLVERDHARAVLLLEEEQAAEQSFIEAKVTLAAAQKEREAAHHAIEGVEEEAEFSEFHAPALVKSSDEMSAIFRRIQTERDAVKVQLALAEELLLKADAEREKAAPLLSHLYCRTKGSVLRTRYGFVEVQFFRTEDKCVVASPLHWEATIFIPMDEILAYEAVYKEEESIVMAAEDVSGHDFVELERKREAKELELMRVEESHVSNIMAWRVKKEQEEQLLTQVICRDELASQLQYEMEGRKVTLETAAKESAQLQRCGRIYPARKRRALTQRPGRLDALRVARASEKRLAMAAIEQRLLGKEKELRHTSQAERDAIYVRTLAGDVFDALVGDAVKELSEEQVQQGLHEAQELSRAKGNAVIASSDRSSGQLELVRPQLGLDRLWVARKKKYNLLYATWRQEFAKLELVREEMARREELRRLAEEERLRLEARRKEMLAEERFCRKFYLEELVLNMQERKAMAAAEVEMQEYLRQLEIEAMKTKYSKMVEDRNRVNDKAARRLEIKLGKNEQHRLHREWRQIKEEDELSMQVREEEIAQSLAEALERQFDKYLADQAVNGKISAEMEASRLAERLREAQQVAAEKRAAFEAKMVQERMIATVETFYALSRAEVAWMSAIERATFWKQRLPPLEAKLRAMEPELKRIEEERQHVVTDAKAKREYADKCHKRIAEADASLTLAIQVKDRTMAKYKRVHKLNATMDSEVLHNRVQRFRTSYLRDQLHRQYFALLTESIVRRAFVECTEREIVRLQERMLQLEQERVFKSKEVSVLQRKRRRTLRMRLRRAELGKLMFGSSRQRLLREKFQQWVRLWSQRVRVRASFKLKHGLLLQKQRLTMTTSSSAMKKESLLRDAKVSAIPTKLSVLHDHQKRILQCRLCRREYSEEQNNRYSCLYHPGKYEFACIRTCETRQKASSGPAAVPASCMMHRAKRWLCCDETEEGRYGSSGCERRFHLPMRNNPELEALVAKKAGEEQTLLDQVNQQLLEMQERNVVGKMKLATKSVLTKMEGDLSKKRARAAKYHTLDRR